MSNTKTVMGQASNQYVVPLDITDVFSTYLYEGTSAAHTITNGIDLAGEGGLVWAKARTQTVNHYFYDTERGVNKRISPNSTASEQNETDALNSFNSNGFTLGSQTGINGSAAAWGSAADYASWTFRKAPKFFDVVTYTGTGDTTTQTISHNLGAVPGCIIVKRTDSSDSWRVYHRGVDVNGDGQPWTDMLTLNTTAAASDFPVWGDTAPTSTEFTVGYESSVNASGATYVAYLFAHNDGDGGFGPDGSDIIKCGSYTGNESSFPTVDLGFEPQFLMIKSATSAEDWIFMDTMRGWLTDGTNPTGDFKVLRPNTSNGEGGSFFCNVTSTGFELTAASADINSNGNTFIYMAIRRGPLAEPKSGTEVFAIDNQTASSAPFLTSNFPVDMVIRKRTTGSNSEVMSRLTQGKGLFANATSAEQTDSVAQFDFNDGCLDGTSTDTSRYGWMWKRAPGYFDVVAYTGNGTAGRTVSHNLGVAPEMMWVKLRDGGLDWAVYHKDLYNGRLWLNDTNAYTGSSMWNNTLADADNFTVGSSSYVNLSNRPFIAYLFASLPGISKVGSVSHTGGSATNVDCGFTAGCRFLILKRTDAASDWWVFDTVRGITSGNDARLILNSTSAETSTDQIDPYSAGFTIDGNRATGEYIFYAIA